MTAGVRTYAPTPAELRAVARALRKRVDQGDWVPVEPHQKDSPDDRLLQTMAGPFRSVDDVLDRLGEAEAYLRQRSDRRSVFLTVYTEMTATVKRGIESGAFESPAWVRDYLVAFAERYRTALLGAERGELATIPPAWRLAFQAAASGETLFLQDALLGVNAHINHDLSYSLRAVGIDPDRRAKHRDHDRINDVLRQLVDVVQRAMADVYDAGGYTHADEWLASVDETVTYVGLSEARSLAWRNAVLLVDTQWPPVERFVDWRIRAVSTGVGYLLLTPSVDPAVLRTLRHLERETLPLASLEATFRQRVSDVTLDLE